MTSPFDPSSFPSTPLAQASDAFGTYPGYPEVNILDCGIAYPGANNGAACYISPENTSTNSLNAGAVGDTLFNPLGYQVQVPAQNLWEPSNPNTPMAARDGYASNVNAQGREGLSLDAFGFRTAHTSTSSLDASAETSNPFNHLGYESQLPTRNWEPSDPNTRLEARDAYTSNVNSQGREGLSLDAYGFPTAYTSTSALDASAETGNPLNPPGYGSQLPTQNWEPSNPNTQLEERDVYASNVNSRGRKGLSLDAFGFPTAHTSTSALDASEETSTPFNHLGYESQIPTQNWEPSNPNTQTEAGKAYASNVNSQGRGGLSLDTFSFPTAYTSTSALDASAEKGSLLDNGGYESQIPTHNFWNTANPTPYTSTVNLDGRETLSLHLQPNRNAHAAMAFPIYGPDGQTYTCPSLETVQATMAQAAIPAANCQWQGTDSSAFVAPASHYPSSAQPLAPSDDYASTVGPHRRERSRQSGHPFRSAKGPPARRAFHDYEASTSAGPQAFRNIQASTSGERYATRNAEASTSALPQENSGPRQARTSEKKPKKSALKKIYQCPHCTYVSDRAHNVKSHVKTVHEEPDKERCHHHGCPRVYKRKADLTKHLREDHGDDIPKVKRTVYPKKIPEDEKHPCELAPECTNAYVNLKSRPYLNHLKNRHPLKPIPPPELVKKEMVRKDP
ncbi:hypothetical protein PCASD_01914 [Puccinia coronata f. sp. avenae]|uniref:C2H2-type domain-containing protein n=1 Tax=Puccinia coronata f. sp. avenae TaxID=200324 RepID=A0A2N5VHI8_9BASI|nr:hypothetical protein PCASD_01914 [Puccinia coronata f. sp. avenae]